MGFTRAANHAIRGSDFFSSRYASATTRSEINGSHLNNWDLVLRIRRGLDDMNLTPKGGYAADLIRVVREWIDDSWGVLPYSNQSSGGVGKRTAVLSSESSSKGRWCMVMRSSRYYTMGRTRWSSGGGHHLRSCGSTLGQCAVAPRQSPTSVEHSSMTRPPLRPRDPLHYFLGSRATFWFNSCGQTYGKGGDQRRPAPSVSQQRTLNNDATNGWIRWARDMAGGTVHKGLYRLTGGNNCNNLKFGV